MSSELEWRYKNPDSNTEEKLQEVIELKNSPHWKYLSIMENGYTMFHDSEGYPNTKHKGYYHNYQIVRITPWDDLKDKDIVAVGNEPFNTNKGRIRVFAGVDKDGNPTTYNFMKDKDNTIPWRFCRKALPSDFE